MGKIKLFWSFNECTRYKYLFYYHFDTCSLIDFFTGVTSTIQWPQQEVEKKMLSNCMSNGRFVDGCPSVASHGRDFKKTQKCEGVMESG
jgi:hypothetical protein